MRRPSQPGRVRIRLAQLIEKTLADGGVEARCDPADLIPVQGYWRSDSRVDVKRWEGRVSVNVPGVGWRKQQINSWDTMTACLRGFTWSYENPWSIEIGALGWIN